MTFLLSGCVVFETNESLMKPPQPVSNINAVIQSYLPSDTSIIKASTGEYLNSYSLIDLDGDGLLEVVAFYTGKQKVTVHGMVLKETNGEWNVVHTFEGDGNALYELDFVDVTNDGLLEIVAGFSFSDAYEVRGLVIYQYDGNEISRNFNTSYTYKVMDDLNEDGVEDITVILLDENHHSNKASIYNYVTQEMKLIDSLPLNPIMLGYYNIVSGYVNWEREKGIVLDVANGMHTAYTNILLFDGSNLKSVFNEEEEPNDKVYRLNSEDINYDGIIEIGIPRIPVGYEDEEDRYIPYINSYYRWDGDKRLQFVSERYNNYKYDYRYELPWFPEYVTIESNFDFKEIKFISTEDQSLLFDIYVIPITEEDKLKGKIELARTDRYVYCTTVDDKNLQREFQLL
ncbi:VCBS repeat-containing protein [Chengkuizengella sediminis]|nr:VCBS repeat-containing protein [Chengkuizengella sediminis]